MTWASRGALVGFLFTFAASLILSTRILEPWKQLPDPPVTALEIVAGPEKTPLIEGPSGSLFAYYEDKWNHIESQDDLPSWGPVTVDDCDVSSEAFWLAPNAPKHVVTCVSLAQPMFESNFSSMVVLDEDGSIWLRRISRHASDSFIYLGFIAIGPVIGALFGWIVGTFTRIGGRQAG
jgi:hypothetical protein